LQRFLKSVFILDERARNLDVQIESHDAFFRLLEQCATRLPNNKDPLSLVAILGKAKRRISGDLEPFERRIVEDINAGNISFLDLDSVQEIEGKNVQLYKVDISKVGDLPF
jgi:hypothetical protein